MTIRTNITKVNDERIRYYAKLAFNKVYYSFDHETSWHQTKSAAYREAQSNGRLAVIDKPVTMSDGAIAIARR